VLLVATAGTTVTPVTTDGVTVTSTATTAGGRIGRSGKLRPNLATAHPRHRRVNRLRSSRSTPCSR
jgi:hypothetical protein